MLRATSVCFRYPGTGGDWVLTDVDLAAEPGQWIAVMGANGSGKSTLLKILAGILTPTSGRVAVDGVDLRDLRTRASVASRVGIVFQDPESQLVSATVERELAFGMERLGVDRQEMHRRVEDILGRFGLGSLAKRPPQSLSGGEKQRVALAGILAMKTRYLLLDEPTALLDAPNRAALLEILGALQSEKAAAVVIATASAEEALRADRVVVLSEGRLAAEGDPRALFDEADRCERWGIGRPAASRLAAALRARGLGIAPGIATVGEFVAAWDEAGGRHRPKGEGLR